MLMEEDVPSSAPRASDLERAVMLTAARPHIRVIEQPRRGGAVAREAWARAGDFRSELDCPEAIGERVEHGRGVRRPPLRRATERGDGVTARERSESWKQQWQHWDDRPSHAGMSAPDRGGERRRG